MGYERGTSVSKEWDEAVTAAALEAADFIVGNNLQWVTDKKQGEERTKAIHDYCHEFVERAFARPLTPDEEALYLTKQFASTQDIEYAVRKVVVLTLLSPRFLYRGLGERPDGWTDLSQLSFALWDTLPTPQSRDVVWQGKLNTPEEIKALAEKMAADPRTWAKLKTFLLSWLKVDEVPEIVKSEKVFPGFTDKAVSDLPTSLEIF